MSSPFEEREDPFAFDEGFVKLPEYKAAASSDLDFDGLLPTPLKLHEDLSNGCGGQLWPAGMVLSKYMLRKHRSDLKGRTMSVDALSRVAVAVAGVLTQATAWSSAREVAW